MSALPQSLRKGLNWILSLLNPNPLLFLLSTRTTFPFPPLTLFHSCTEDKASKAEAIATWEAEHPKTKKEKKEKREKGDKVRKVGAHA